MSYSYVIVDDYGSTNHGQYDLIDQSGNVLATVSQTEYITYVTPQGIGLPPLVSTMPMSNSQVAFGQALIQQVFQTLNLINNPNPQTNGTNGSSTPEQLNSPLFPQLIHDQGTTPLDLNGSGGGSSSGTPLTVTIDIITPPPIIAATNVFIWTSPSSGTFQTAPDWNAGAVPAASDTVEINNPLVTVTIDQVETDLFSLVPHELRGKIAVQAIVVPGDPTEELLYQGRAQQADLIVLSARAASAFAAVTRNGVVYKVLAHSHCPVITLSPAVFSACGMHSEKRLPAEAFMAGVF